MKQVATYHKVGGGEIKIEYDDEAPCRGCGEPVIGASMAGTDVCGSCDMGKCRYCGTRIFVLKEEVDGGQSRRNLLSQMKWHRERDPDLNQKLRDVPRKQSKELESKSSEKEKVG